jgi:hypothetical protein
MSLLGVFGGVRWGSAVPAATGIAGQGSPTCAVALRGARCPIRCPARGAERPGLPDSPLAESGADPRIRGEER